MTVRPSPPAVPQSAIQRARVRLQGGIARRELLAGGLAGGGLVAAGPLAAAPGARGGFTHGVASGEPGSRRVLLWTRYAAAQDTALRFEVADTLDFARLAGGGTATASPARDHCAKAWAEGLEPGRWYYYRFIAPDGTMSDVGRTRTLPEGPVARWRMAVFSCSNIGFGWFNAYAHAAAADEFDCALHLGDYLYEYRRGDYPDAAETAPGRAPLEPVGEMIALADYRARYAQYRSDPDLRRLHQVYPLIVVADDHETANDAWWGGAENHDPASEGPWDARKAAAMQAWHEWLPVSDEPWAEYKVGTLATLFRLETRLTARDKQLSLAAALAGKSGPEAAGALAAFRDGPWRDPRRELLGAAQQAWLAAGLARSRREGAVWQVLVQQVLMATLATPRALLETLPGDAPAALRAGIAESAAAGAAGLPLNMDSWDGYPAARERVLLAARAADANLISLAGDSHNAWASDLRLGEGKDGGEAAGVEFAVQSVTSPGYEAYLPFLAPDALPRLLAARNPTLHWADTTRRGYMAVELTPARASAEFRFTGDVRRRGVQLAEGHRLSVEAGARRFTG